MKLRIERLKELIRETAAEVILHELTHPRLGFCTLTRPALADDLSHCTIYVSVLGDQKAEAKTMYGLQDARGLIQKRIAGQMKTRTTPHVKLELDETIEKTFEIMAKIKEARASDPDGGTGVEEPSKKVDDISDNV